ncbi:cation:proton antiporter [Trichothermofontia sp.]
MALETTDGMAIELGLQKFLLVLSVSLSVATLPQVFAWARHIPYTLLLVIVGLGLATVDVRLVNLSPELILLIFLPPLLFEAAWNLKWSDLKRDLFPISLYAIPGVILSVLGIAVALKWGTGMALPIALLVGASLAATDPVAVIALFKELGAPTRLKTLVEGESLFNDGVAVVAFTLLVGIPLGLETFSPQATLVRFFIFVGIGVGIGSLIGFGISYLTQRFDLPLVEQSLTLVAAYGAYLVTEELGGSGVIAVVIVGLVLGNFGSRIGMNPRTRVIVSEFWDFLAFFINSIIFLLIGDQIRWFTLEDNLIPIGVTIAAVLVMRGLGIYLLSLIGNWVTRPPVDLTTQTVLWWGGLRGSVAIALALSVPQAIVERDEIITIVFGTVLFTLLVQGLTMKPLLEGLHLLGKHPLRQHYLEVIARQTALSRVLEYLQAHHRRLGIEPEFYRYHVALVEGELAKLQAQSQDFSHQDPEWRTFVVEEFRKELQAIEAATYAEYVRSGWFNQELSPFLAGGLEDSQS